MATTDKLLITLINGQNSCLQSWQKPKTYTPVFLLSLQFLPKKTMCSKFKFVFKKFKFKNYITNWVLMKKY